ncbi:MAG: protein phosphatase 2C domain-containing protein [Terracidiphilus sp.]|jgi:protein phosphatase
MNDLAPSGLPILSFAEECNRGKVREENQDSVLHFRIALGELSVVADGIGGLEGGATASRIVTETFYEHLRSLPQDYPADTAIREASALANANILASAADPESPFHRMGSTVVLALIQTAHVRQESQQPARQDAVEARAWIGHIGDSRAYLLRNGRISRLTKDHSAVQDLIDQNLLSPEEAGNHPDASVLTRSLGHYIEVEIDVDTVPLVPGDSLLLCSDGLWGFVPEKELETVMADVHLPIEATAKTLLEMALAAGGHDNIGIELVRVGLPPAPVLEVVHQKAAIPEPPIVKEPLQVEEPLKAQQPVSVEEPIKAEEPLKVQAPVEVQKPVKGPEMLEAKEQPKIQEPVKLGFIGTLLLFLLAGAGVGAILYLAFYGH